jgi:hypothetical protein
MIMKYFKMYFNIEFNTIFGKNIHYYYYYYYYYYYFLVGSILKRCGKFHFDFFVEYVQSNQISSF